jgi:hypothetical protein
MPQNAARACCVLRPRRRKEQTGEPVHIADHRRRDRLPEGQLGDLTLGAADDCPRDICAEIDSVEAII